MLAGEVNHFFAELVDDVLGDAGLPGARRTIEDGRVGVVAASDRVERGGERVDLAVPVSYVVGHKLRVERTSISHRVSGYHDRPVTKEAAPGFRFPILPH